VRVSPAKERSGERLPYLLGKLKAPRVLERLEQTATLAREQEWPYERFLETLLEAEVFARDASGARVHPPRRLPGAEDARGLRLERAALRGAAARAASRPAGLDRGARQRLLPRPARHRQDPL
jgi:hypothetical protein